MAVCVADDVALHFHVLHNEVGTVQGVGHDSPDESGCKYHSIRSFLIEEFLDCILVCEVEFFVCATYEVSVTPFFQVIPNGRAHKSAMAGDVYFAVLV